MMDEEEAILDLTKPPTARLVVTPSGKAPVEENDLKLGIEDGDPLGGAPIQTLSDESEELAGDPFEIAASRTKKSVKERKQSDAKGLWESAVDAFVKFPAEQLKSIDESFSGRYVPDGAVSQNDSGEFLDKEGNVLPVTRKPTILPVTKDPVSGDKQAAMPGALDVLVTPGGTSGRTATLGAGFVGRSPGVGHNQGPPFNWPHGPGSPPPPGGAGPAVVTPQPPRIVRGLDDRPPVTAHGLYTQVYDDLHPLKRLQDELDEIARLDPEEKFYNFGRLTRGNYGRTEQALRNGTFDYETLQNVGPALAHVLKPVSKNLEQFEEFALSMRALEWERRGLETGVDPVSARAIVASAPNEFRAAFNGLKRYQDEVFQYLIDSGLVSEDAARAMRDLNREYVPFYRFMDDAGDPKVGGRNLQGKNPIKGAKGSEREFLSPVESIIRNTHQYIDLAEKNRTMIALEDAARNRGLVGPNGILRPVPPSAQRHLVTKDDVERFFNDNGIPVPTTLANAPDSFAIFRRGKPQLADNEIAVYRDGKPTIYKVDPEIAQAVRGMGPRQVSDVLRLAAIPTQAVRAGSVLGPELLYKNPLRDQVTAAVISNNGYLPVYSYFKGLAHYGLNTETYQNWLKSGGANAALTSVDRKYLEEYISLLTKNGIGPRKEDFKHPVRYVLGQLSKIAEIGEQPTRIAEYSHATSPGPVRSALGAQPKTPHEAAYEAREVTLDFQRAGAAEFVKMWGQLAEFFNAALQGPDRLARSFKDSPAATSTKVAAYVVAPTLLAYAMNRNDPRMMEIPRHERDTYWHLPISNWQVITEADAQRIPDAWKKQEDGIWYMNNGPILKFPKPFEIGVIFGSTFERGLDDYFDKHPEAWKDFQKSVIQSTTPQLMPTFVRVPFEMALNKSLFRGTEIVTDRAKNPKDRRYEYYPYTTESAKMLANVTGALMPESFAASPAMVEYMIQGWSGSLGAYTLQATDKILGGVQSLAGKEKKRGEEPEKQLADYPVLKALFSRVPSTSAPSVKDFFENRDASRATLNTARRLLREHETDDSKSVLANDVAVKMDTTSRAISAQYRLIEQIRNSPNLTPREKRVQIDKASMAIVLMAQHANKNYYELQSKIKIGTEPKPVPEAVE